ncbi:MAG: metal-sensing transcriptional repressor [Candidatus Methylomirabilales bacterium]
MPGSHAEHRDELLARLRRVEGQIRGIQRFLPSPALGFRRSLERPRARRPHPFSSGPGRP